MFHVEHLRRKVLEFITPLDRGNPDLQPVGTEPSDDELTMLAIKP